MPDEDGELEHVPRAAARQHGPQQPEHRLRDAHRPDRAVEVAALVAFVLRRRLHARQEAEQPERPDGARHGEVGDVVDLAQLPRARDDRPHQAGDVQHRERDDRAPRERVADAPIERVRLVLGEADDVRRGLDARQLPEQARDAGAGEHDAQPRRHAPVEAVREQIERERPGRDEEGPDPDRPVVQAIADLVALADLPIRRALHQARVPDLLVVRAAARGPPALHARFAVSIHHPA